MKLINKSAIGVCLLVSLSAHAQQTGKDTVTKFTPPVIVKDEDTATKFTPPVIVKDEEPAQKSESKKEEYKSKEWRQGDVVLTDTTKGSGVKGKRIKRPQRPAPPPPPPAAPAKP